MRHHTIKTNSNTQKAYSW